MENTRRFYVIVHLNDEEKKKLKELAERHGLSMAAVLRLAFYEYLRRLEKETITRGN